MTKLPLRRNRSIRGLGSEIATGQRWTIHLDGKKVGQIYEFALGETHVYRYVPLGSPKHIGEAFPNFAACRASLD